METISTRQKPLYCILAHNIHAPGEPPALVSVTGYKTNPSDYYYTDLSYVKRLKAKLKEAFPEMKYTILVTVYEG